MVNASGGGDHTRIQWAIDNASDGDTVYVEAGTYYGNVVINKTIGLIGWSKYNTFIHGDGGYNVIVINANWVYISGFTIMNSRTDSYYGIYIAYPTFNCTIKNNIFTNNSIGIQLYGEGGHRISDNHISNCRLGIRVDSDSNFIINNTIIRNNDYGIFLDGTENNDIINNNCSENNYGIYLDHYKNINNFIEKNYCCDNENDGIYDQGGNNIISQNICDRNNGTGISINSRDNIIKGNIINENSEFGILLKNHHNILLNNVMMGNGVFMDLILGGETFNAIDTSNTVNGKPVYFWKNQKGGIIPEGAGQVIIVNCTNIIIKNQNLSNASIGIWLGYSKNITVEDNVCNFNYYGMYITKSGNNNISNTYFNSNQRSGIILGGSGGNTLYNNSFNSNRGDGCRIGSVGNKIFTNSFISNDQYAIYTSGKENDIQGNIFVNNNPDGGTQACDNSTELWFNYWSRNYWSDWIGPDQNSNGIVDIPYVMDGLAGDKDNLPLVNPPQIPIPIAEAGDDMTVHSHQLVTFDGTGSHFSEYITKYRWEIEYQNDSHYQYGARQNHTFPDPGVFTVELTVENSLGHHTSDSMIVTVIEDNIKPLSNAGEDIIIDQHEIVHLNGSGSNDNVGIVNFTWTIFYGEDKISLYRSNPTVSFAVVGKYIVELNVSDAEGNWDIDTLNVTVLDITPPIADAGPEITINQSETVEFFFHQHSTDNVGCWNWTWTFEYNGTEQTLFHSVIMSSLPLFKFDIPGIYTVTMNVTDEAGNWATDTLNVTVLDIMLPDADAGGGQEIDAGTSYRFNGTGSGDNVGIVNYTWIFEYDGKTVTLFGPSPEFTLEVPGEYDIELVVTDAEGNSASNSMSITVTPKDDDIGPIDNGEDENDKGRRVAVWIWLSIAVFIIAVIVVLLLFFLKKKEEGDTVLEEDEMGRVGKDGGVRDDE